MNEAIIRGNYADHKPDFGYATKNGGKHEWAGQGCVGQVKRWGRKRGQKLRCDVQIDLGELQVSPVNQSSVGAQVLRLLLSVQPDRQNPYKSAVPQKPQGRKRGRPDTPSNLLELPSKRLRYSTPRRSVSVITFVIHTQIYGPPVAKCGSRTSPT